MYRKVWRPDDLEVSDRCLLPIIGSATADLVYSLLSPYFTISEMVWLVVDSSDYFRPDGRVYLHEMVSSSGPTTAAPTLVTLSLGQRATTQRHRRVSPLWE